MLKVKTEIYSRVSGYYRPVSQWNKGKQSEFSDRNTIKEVPECSNCKSELSSC